MKLIYRCLCAVLGAILGSGCSDSSEPVEYGPMPEYGMPTGTVRVDGRALDVWTGEPIRGIAVSLAGAGGPAAADTTDATGAWAIDVDGVLLPCMVDDAGICAVVATDIDGPANGGPFPPSTVALDLEQTVPPSGAWDLGTWEQHGLDIVMSDAVDYGPRPVGKRR